MSNLAPPPAALKRPLAERRQLPSRWYLTDARRTPDPLTAIGRLRPGDGVIFRHYEAPNRGELAGRVATLCRRRGLILLIAGDSALARRVGADGVHLPEYQLERPTNGAVRFLTAAAHSRRALMRAWRLGVDAALVSPVFATASHPGAPALGLHRFARLIAGIDLPIYALGGVDAETGKRLAPFGLAGIAGISLFE